MMAATAGNGRPCHEQGQSLAEIAMVLPILLLVLLGIVDFGRVLLSYSAASNALHDALRNAEVAGVNELATDYSNCREMRRRLGEALTIGDSTITVQYQKNDTGAIVSCLGDSIDPALLASGDLLQINITSKVHLITPLINSMAPALTFTVSGESAILIGAPRTVANANSPDLNSGSL